MRNTSSNRPYSLHLHSLDPKSPPPCQTPRCRQRQHQHLTGIQPERAVWRRQAVRDWTRRWSSWPDELRRGEDHLHQVSCPAVHLRPTTNGVQYECLSTQVDSPCSRSGREVIVRQSRNTKLSLAERLNMFLSDLSLSRHVHIHGNQLRSDTWLGTMQKAQEERVNLALIGRLEISEKLFKMSTQSVGCLCSFLLLN